MTTEAPTGPIQFPVFTFQPNASGAHALEISDDSADAVAEVIHAQAERALGDLRGIDDHHTIVTRMFAAMKTAKHIDVLATAAMNRQARDHGLDVEPNPFHHLRPIVIAAFLNAIGIGPAHPMSVPAGQLSSMVASFIALQAMTIFDFEVEHDYIDGAAADGALRHLAEDDGPQA